MRHPDWKLRLSQLIDRRRDTPFAWGTHDCHTWGREVVFAVTGRVIPPGGAYNSARGAVRELQRRGAANYRAGVAQALGATPADVRFAHRGDLVIADRGKGRMPVVGVYLGDGVASPGPNGLESRRFPREALTVFPL